MNSLRDNELLELKRVFILIAPNFDEETVVYCLCRMREKKIPIGLVGNISGLLSGLHGITLNTDHSLTQVEQAKFTSKHLMIIPGSCESVTRLLTDPRLHHLMNNILEANGSVAIMASAQEAFANLHLPVVQQHTHFLKQGNKKTSVFVNELVHFAS